MERSDQQLVADYCSGDRGAGDQLVRRHLASVRNLLFQLVLDSHAADDLTQEAFSRAWHSLATYRGDAQFATWLHRIALNTAYRYLRELPRNRWQALPEETADRSSADAGLEPVDTDRITAALGQLSPPLRAAIVLTVMQGYSAGEAAGIEGCSIGTMYWRVHEARARLKRALKDDFG